MSAAQRKTAITGASGYLGGIFARRLQDEGDDVVRLVRPSNDDESNTRRFLLGSSPSPDLFAGIDLFIHCAYDLKLTDEREIWRVNVDGSRRLLAAAQAAGVRRIITISSMSAFDGTKQIYGRAKLEIERATHKVRGVSVRPGLVWGEQPGGMAGSLRKLTHLPVVPVFGGTARQFLVHQDDLADAVAVLAETGDPPSRPIGIANPDPVPFRQLLEALARDEHRSPRFVAVPWQSASKMLRLAELFRLPLPFRSDSLLGLVHPPSFVPEYATLTALGIEPRAFPWRMEDRRA